MPVRRIVHGKLTPNQAETVSPGALRTQARVLNIDGADRIYIRGDGIDPAPPWTDCEVIPAAMGYVVVKLRADKDGDSEVRLRSPGSPEYSVTFLT
jgi:hypothetical protein